jgi:hypothetical protein
VAYYRGWAASNTQAAIMRLGLAATRDLLFQVVYAAQGPAHQAEAQAAPRSVVAGIACRNVCRELSTHYEYDYMCGLLHDIGEARVSHSGGQPRPKRAWTVNELAALSRDGAEVARTWKTAGRHRGRLRGSPRRRREGELPCS